MKVTRPEISHILETCINNTTMAFIVAIFLLACNLNAVTITVTNNADTGTGTLRQALADANDGDVIEFYSSVTYITLTSGVLRINDSIHIKGSGPKKTIINGNTNDRGFYMTSSGTTSTISGVTITNCAVTGLSKGGGIYLGTSDSLSITISNCVIIDCISAGGGGGIGLTGGKAVIIDTTIARCSVTESSNDGGAIHNNTDINLYMKNCTIYGNQAADDGGGIYSTSPFTAVNCTISGNIANDQGGGVYMNSGSGETQKLYNCTVYNNIGGAGKGDGVYRYGYSGSVELYSNIIASNAPSYDIYGAVNVLKYNFFNTSDYNSWTPIATNNISGDADLLPLADNGGSTLTHALLKDSKAIDAGSNPLSLASDQRGVGYPRETGIGQPDIGAYEFNSGAPLGAVVVIQ